MKVFHIPVCPFCQRLEILVALKGVSSQVHFEVVDITKPRDPHLLTLTGGTTSLPVMELDGGRSLKESLVLLDFLEHRFPETRIRRTDPYERGIEGLLVTLADGMMVAGYRLVMNQDLDQRDARVEAWTASLLAIDAFLTKHGQETWLFDEFGWAELAFTPFFQRFAFLDYYEGFSVPEGPDFDRVRRWWAACVAHPAAQQTSDEEVIKSYYDYARGKGNGALPEGRTRSSFVFEPSWRDRPWPPKDKYKTHATDAELGLL
ncbi:MAG: glutathione S-transferase family protein [Proteobacteria bacterium]|nr:glutathione S-transferase family protein [Pseudomonadota bacterium]